MPIRPFMPTQPFRPGNVIKDTVGAPMQAPVAPVPPMPVPGGGSSDMPMPPMPPGQAGPQGMPFQMPPGGALPFYPPNIMQIMQGMGGGLPAYNPMVPMGAPGGAVTIQQLLGALKQTPPTGQSFDPQRFNPWPGRAGGDRMGQVGNPANRPGMSFRDWSRGLLSGLSGGLFGGGSSSGGNSGGGGYGSDAEREARAESGRNQRGV